MCADEVRVSKCFVLIDLVFRRCVLFYVSEDREFSADFYCCWTDKCSENTTSPLMDFFCIDFKAE